MAPPFLLGVASGMVLLPLSAYRRVSPQWLKWLLVATGVAMLARYLRLASLPAGGASPWDVAEGIGLTLPGVFAVDQLVRHPAMTPKKLLRWYAPFVLLYVAGFLLPGGLWAAMPTVAFALVFLWVVGLLLPKLPDRRIRLAVGGLGLAYLFMGVATVCRAVGAERLPLLYAEMFTCLALWQAYDQCL